jgi:hypothetical protein
MPNIERGDGGMTETTPWLSEFLDDVLDVLPMESNIPSSQAVRFEGPALTRQTRGALSAAGITVVERRRSTAWGEQLQNYLVTVAARNGEDAVRRVRAAVERHGRYSAFASDPQ